MIRFASVAAIVFALTACSQKPAAPTAGPSAERAYIERRDALAAEMDAEFKKENVDIDALSKRDNAAMKELEAMIIPIVGPVAVEGFTAAPAANIATLMPEMDFGLLDGVAITNENETLVATTVSLLRKHAQVGARNLGDVVWGQDNYYTRVFGGGVHHYFFTEIPVKTPYQATAVSAALICTTNDLPWGTVPQVLIVFAADDHRAMIIKSVVRPALPKIPDCSDIVNGAASRMEGVEAEDRLSREEAAVEAYIGCWNDLARDQVFYPMLVKQAQSMVDRLAPALARK